MEPASKKQSADQQAPWWKRDPIAQRLLALGGSPPKRQAHEVPLPAGVKLPPDSPSASEQLIRERRESLGC